MSLILSAYYLCSAGPIIEQGTHFCDLSRYFGGEVDIASVQAHSLEWNENAGQLSKMTIDESKILPENRIPRVTAATWCDNLFLLLGRLNAFPQLSGSMTVGP